MPQGREKGTERPLCHHHLQRNTLALGCEEPRGSAHFCRSSVGTNSLKHRTAELRQGHSAPNSQAISASHFSFLGFNPVVGGPSGCHILECSLLGTSFHTDAELRALGAVPNSFTDKGPP